MKPVYEHKCPCRVCGRDDESVLGKTLVPKLVAAGHTVSAMSRTPENDDRLRHAGAHPVRVDLFDVEALKQVLAGHEAIYHLATKIPSSFQRKYEHLME